AAGPPPLRDLRQPGFGLYGRDLRRLGRLFVRGGLRPRGGRPRPSGRRHRPERVRGGRPALGVRQEPGLAGGRRLLWRSARLRRLRGRPARPARGRHRGLPGLLRLRRLEARPLPPRRRSGPLRRAPHTPGRPLRRRPRGPRTPAAPLARGARRHERPHGQHRALPDPGRDLRPQEEGARRL
ncbi:MAG: CDP-diacylglycerol--serine O-phosphatidyltransferase, partial [uncultured Rubrobacteraceae bacterium]